jgi:GGDEF domain-containing protein
LDRLARYDTLTGALNRAEFVRRLDERIGAGAEGCAVIVFSVHRLQTINATLGRALGDALLIAIVEKADRLVDLGLSRLARLGGDRFAAFTTALPEPLGPNTAVVLPLSTASPAMSSTVRPPR